MKRKATPAQLRALAKGRKKRKQNLAKKKKKRKRKPSKRRIPKKPRKKRNTTKLIGGGIMSNAQLTGGTGDVNPQFYSGSLLMSAANTLTSTAFISPVAKGIFSKTGKATVMEILQVFVSMPTWDAMATATELTDSRIFSIGTKELSALTMDEGSLIAFFSQVKQGAFTADGTFGMESDNVYVWDITDSLGHGVLIATDYIYATGDTTGYAGAATFGFKLLYRFKNVSMQEYVGIVQSQQ